MLLALVLLVIILGIAISKNSQFQTFIIHTYLKKLSEQLHTSITVENVDVNFFTGVSLKKLLVKDLQHDTLAFITNLTVDVKTFSINDKQIFIDEIKIDEAYFNVVKYKTESSFNYQFIVKHFATSDTTVSDWSFKLDNVIMNNCKLAYNHEDYLPKYGIDYNHTELNNLNLEISDIEFIPKGINCNINKLSFKEKSGFELNQLTSDFNISPKGISAQQLKIITPNSNLKGTVNLLTNNYNCFSSFIDSVSINSYLEPSTISFKDICYFSSKLECLNKSFEFEGEVRGKISNLKAKKITIKLDDGTYFNGNVNITGIPDAENMFMHIKANELITSKAQLEQFPIYPFAEERFIIVPDNFKHLGVIRFKGTYTGFYHDFVAYGSFYTSAGRIATDLTMKMVNNETFYKGNITTNEFKLGKFLEIENQIGSISMDAEIDGKGFNINDLETKLKGKINQVNIRNYNYRGLTVEGLFANKIFSGLLEVRDENIDLDFNGSINFSKSLPEMKFQSNIRKAKLAKLNLTPNDSLNANFSMNLDIDLIGNHIDNLYGTASVYNLRLKDDVDDIRVANILINSEINNGIKKLSINSTLLNGSIEGKYNFKDLANAFTSHFSNYLPSFNLKESQNKIDNDFKFNFITNNTELLTKLFLNGTTFSKDSELKGSFNSEEQSYNIEGFFPEIKTKGITISSTKLNGKTTKQKLLIDFSSNRIKQNDSLYIDNFISSSSVFKDTILTNIKWKNNDTTQRTEADINIVTNFTNSTHFFSKITESKVYLSDTLWNLNSNNLIEVDFLDNLIFSVTSLGFSALEQRLLIDGKITGKPTDQIDIALTKFNLNNFQQMIPTNVVQFDGIINGVASIKKEDDEFIFTSNLNFERFILNETNLGDGSIVSSWYPIEKKLNVNGQFYKGHLPTIIFKGNYHPFRKKESIDLDLTLQRTDVQLFRNYTESILTNLRGVVSANLKLNGTIKEPSFNGTVHLQKTSFLVNYLNTNYSTPSCKIDIKPDMISFDNVVFYDEKGNKAISNGTVFHKYFKEVSMDLGFYLNNFHALNTSIKENELFYGKAFVSGLVNIGIYKNKLNIELDVKTEKETVMNIPLNTAEEISESNFIEFFSNEIDNEIEEDKVDLSNIELNFILHATPDAEVRLIFDEKVGDVLRARGDGDLTIKINDQGDFKMYGDYIVKDGDYLFTLQNVINKRFNLEEGGKISWNGNPLDAELNLTAVYRLRARLYELLANQEDSASAEMYKKRSPINLKLNITNTITSPNISFDIDLPTTDEATKNKVRSILYVNNQQENIQELNKQVFSLLVLNQFIPPTGGGTSSYSNVGSTTSFEMLSNQLSNYLSKISNRFDVGFNYRPGDEISSQEVELALSTQLFNDRVVIDGNFGVSDNKGLSNNNQNTSNFVGDFSIEYKITEDGKLRVKAFNQSNQSSLQRRSSNYTQGFGLFYRKEFDKFSDLFRRSVATRKDD